VRLTATTAALMAVLSAPDALDLSKESEETRTLYGLDQKPTADFARSCLTARRLLERGVRFVQLWSGTAGATGNWDNHADIAKELTHIGTSVDRPIAGLLKDLKRRGMLEDTLVVCVGEFGRSPKRGVSTSGNSNNPSGRDHWPYCFTAVLAGAGIRGGHVHGESDATGSAPVRDPVHPTQLVATIYHAVGIDPGTIVYNHLNQPRELVQGEPVTELFA